MKYNYNMVIIKYEIHQKTKKKRKFAGKRSRGGSNSSQTNSRKN